MDKVVYVIGAGFSAPLGLPVMSNFLSKSKDMYAEDSEKYAHFDTVFKQIDQMSVCKTFYSADLLNIEEILSIFEMEKFLSGESKLETFTQYIKDVIEFYTREVSNSGIRLPANWNDVIFSHDPVERSYGLFVLNLLQCQLLDKEGSRFCQPVDSATATYSVLSLNYDTVLEKFCDYIRRMFQCVEGVTKFDRWPPTAGEPNPPPSVPARPKLVKLHGSVDTQTIVPPTWSKGNDPSIAPGWEKAYRLLREANHIRFLGYSLPDGDSYVRYLLKAAGQHASHLKSIDALCYSRDDSVEHRFKGFIEFRDFRFVNRRIEDYLEVCCAPSFSSRRVDEVRVQRLALDNFENLHERFFSDS